VLRRPACPRPLARTRAHSCSTWYTPQGSKRGGTTPGINGPVADAQGRKRPVGNRARVGSFIFRNRLGLPLRRATLAKITAKWGKAAGVPQRTPHRFRHTFGTELLRKTKNLRLVQEAMGHADIQSTVVYTQVAASELEAGVARLYGGDNNPSSGEK
jgi:integrase